VGVFSSLEAVHLTPMCLVQVSMSFYNSTGLS